MDRQIFTIEQPTAIRLDRALADHFPDYTRSALVKMIEQGNVLVNGKTAAKNMPVKAGDIIDILFADAVETETVPENIPLDIVYEDEDLLVVNKPQGMVVHPAPGNWDGTLVNALLYHCASNLSGINGVIRPGIVHRIDKDTSGLLIVAKDDHAHQGLAAQIKEHCFTREYEAVVHGVIQLQEGTIDAPIGRHPVKRKQMAVTDKHARNAVTHYHVIRRYHNFTHVRMRLETGRTHQIRVHMAYIGHPVAGDPLYGPKKTFPGLQGQCLHAKKIGFLHPSTGVYMEFDSPLPDYFMRLLEKLEKMEG